jgi:hypothetical protein
LSVFVGELHGAEDYAFFEISGFVGSGFVGSRFFLFWVDNISIELILRKVDGRC